MYESILNCIVALRVNIIPGCILQAPSMYHLTVQAYPQMQIYYIYLPDYYVRYSTAKFYLICYLCSAYTN
jgi:hypothetical protein